MTNKIYVVDPTWADFTFNNIVQPLEIYDHLGNAVKEIYDSNGALSWDGFSTESFSIPGSDIYHDARGTTIDVNHAWLSNTLTNTDLVEATGYCKFWQIASTTSGILYLTVTGGLQEDSIPENIIETTNASDDTGIISSKFSLSPIYSEFEEVIWFRQPQINSTDSSLRQFPRECLAWDQVVITFSDGTTYTLSIPYHSKEYLNSFNSSTDFYVRTYVCYRNGPYGSDVNPVINYDWGTTKVGNIQIRFVNARQYLNMTTSEWSSFRTKLSNEDYTLTIRMGPKPNLVRTWANTKVNERGTGFIFDGFGIQNQTDTSGQSTIKPVGSTLSGGAIDPELKPRFSYAYWTADYMSLSNHVGNFGSTAPTLLFDHAENRSWVLIANRYRDVENSSDPDIEPLSDYWGYNKQFIATSQVLNSSQSPFYWQRELWTYDSLNPAPSNINDYRVLFPYDETFTFKLYELYGRPY